jgi:hypothetical protein
MPSARDWFTRVQIGPNELGLLGVQFIFDHQSSPQFDPTAEVAAEVSILRVLQGAYLRRD